MSRGLLIDAKAAALQDRLFFLLQNPREAARIIKGLRDVKPDGSVGDATLDFFKSRFGEILIDASRRAGASVTAPLSEETPLDPARPTLPPVPERLKEKLPALDTRAAVDVPQFRTVAERVAATQPAAPAPRPTGQANPQQRAGLATLFPDDPILGAGRNVG